MKMDSRLSRRKTLPDVFSLLCFQYIIILVVVNTFGTIPMKISIIALFGGSTL